MSAYGLFMDVESNLANGTPWVGFSGMESDHGIALYWESDASNESDSVFIERGRDNHHFEAIAKVANTENNYYDSLALFGEYYYRLRSSTKKGDQVSESILVESYGGSSCRSLYPKEGVTAGTTVNLVYGNAQKGQAIWVGIFKRNAVQLGHFVDVPLDNQLLKMETDSLQSGKYLLVTKLENLPMNIYRFKIK